MWMLMRPAKIYVNANKTHQILCECKWDPPNFMWMLMRPTKFYVNTNKTQQILCH